MAKKFDSDNAVLSFHIYMWIDYCDQVGPTAAVAFMVRDLDSNNLNKLIDRACELYDGRQNR